MEYDWTGLFKMSVCKQNVLGRQFYDISAGIDVILRDFGEFLKKIRKLTFLVKTSKKTSFSKTSYSSSGRQDEENEWLEGGSKKRFSKKVGFG